MESPELGPRGGGEIGSKIGVRFYRYRAILKKYWWVIAICMGTVLAYEAWVVLTKPTRYISTGKLSIRETSNDEKSMMVRGDPSWYGTVIKTIESPAVRERTKALVSLERPGKEGMVDGVAVSALNEVNTYFFAVTCTGPEPDFTAYCADRIMDAFMQMRRDESSTETANTRKVLETQMEREKGEVDEAQKILDAFVDKENVPFINQKAQQIASDLTDLRKSIDTLQEDLTALEHMADADVLNNQNGGNKDGPKRAVDTDTREWTAKQQELADKTYLLKKHSEFWKPNNPKYKQLVQEIERINVAITVLKERATNGRAAGVESLKTAIADKQQRMTEYEQSAREFSKVLTRYKSLQDEVTRRLDNYKATRKNLDDLIRNPVSSEILTIQQKASAPVEESRGIIKGLLTGVFGGLLLGLGILFVLDRADDRLASSSEMIEQFNEPILGQIPDVADSRTNEGLPLLQTEDDRYMYAESFRSLRSSLIFMPNQTELKSLIITSAIPNEGKSTIASNLAITMANAGARVLLVDADLRRGDIAALFDTDGRQGLANILRGEVNWKDCVKSLRNDKLHIIPRGPVTNQSGELLLQPGLPKLLTEWKAGYDLVIFNTAPILATDDTPTLAPNFDGTLMVIRASFTSARLTRNALNALYQRQVNVLGLILNCVDTEMPDYYYYRYPKYYAA